MRPGDVVASRFEIEVLAGSGAGGLVYRARDRTGGSPVAVKVLHRGTTFDAERFRRESSLLAELACEGVVRYVAHGALATGATYLAMEWLDGEDLRARMTRQPLTVEETVALGVRVATTLGELHRAGIVHRDVKPANILLVSGAVGRATLLDFGLARHRLDPRQVTHSGVPLGTPGYMAPEQARGERSIDGRADIFSLGCVLFRCLTGRGPFDGDNLLGVLLKVVLEEPPPLGDLRPDLPQPLIDIVERMLEKEPSARPADGAALAAELLAIDAPIVGPAPPTSRAIRGITATERRLVSLLVSSDLADSGGVALEHELLERASAAGGRPGVLADGSIFAIFSDADVATDLAAAAARCAVAISRIAPRTKLALVAGSGLLSSRPMEELIDAAVTKLGAVAEGAIALDELTARLLEGRFEVRAIDGRLELVRERELDLGRPLLGKATPCIGREREIGQLTALMEECVGERAARVAMLVGEAGVGKSRLAHEALRRLRVPAQVIAGRGDPMSRQAPFALARVVLERAAGIREEDPPEERRRKLMARVTRSVAGPDRTRVAVFLGELCQTPFGDADAVELRSARAEPMLMGDQMLRAWEDWLDAECRVAPVIVLLDDMQWADAPTIRLVHGALRRLARAPFFVLGLKRLDGSDAPRNPFPIREGIDLLVGPLSPRESERFVRAVLGDAAGEETIARVVERAGGNPFFLEEVVRGVAAGNLDTLPATVTAMVQSRIQALDPDERRLLRAASIFGQEFRREGARTVLGGPRQTSWLDDSLDRLCECELLVRSDVSLAEHDRSYAFRDALVREAAYEMLTSEDAELGHRLAGAWLERTGGTPLTIAEHFVRGGQSRRAVGCFAAAAEQALRASELQLAVSLARRGVECGAEGENLGALLVVESSARGWLGEHAAARTLALEAVRLSPRGGTGACTALATAITASARLGDRGSLCALANDARELLLTREPSLALLRTACIASSQLFRTGRPDEANELLELADAMADRDALEEPIVRARLTATKAVRAHFAGDLGMFELELLAADQFERGGDVRNAAVRRINATHAWMELGGFDEAAATLRDTLATAEQMRVPLLVDACKQNLARALGALGELETAFRFGREALESYAAQADPRNESGCRVYLARLHARTGDLEAAEAEARAALQLLDAASTLRPLALGLLATVLLSQGRIAEAAEPARAAVAQIDSLPLVEEGESLARLADAEVRRALGDRDGARAAIAAAVDRLRVRADKIRDPRWRACFLDVPENARILELARAWRDDEAGAGP